MLSVKKRNGRLEPLNVEKINRSVSRACEGLEGVSVSEIVLDAQLQFFDKITTKEIDKALILSARSKVDKEPNYSYAAARLLLNTIYKEVFGEGVDSDLFEIQYRKSFVTNLKALIKNDRLDPRLSKLFDLKDLAEYLKPERDELFKCMGVQILYDRYFQHIDGRRMESPQAFWMRVAMGLALAEKDNHTEWAKKFYDELSNMRLVPSTPTLFNSGTTSSQMSSCYLSQFADSIHGIFRGIHQQAMLSKHAGGLGVDASRLRATGSWIKKTNGVSGGIIPWIKILGDMALAVNQAGLRKGACAVYLQVWHADIEDYQDLRKPVGDERRRTLDLNTVNYIPDLFLERVNNDEMWSLFCPNETESLVGLYGKEFRAAYEEFERAGQAGELRVYKQIPAKDLWKRMISSQLQFGGPWQTFKDTINMRNPVKHLGPIHNSNLCTEVTLTTQPSVYDDVTGNTLEDGLVAVCNILNVNYSKFVDKGKLTLDAMANSIRLGVRMLDNVIDENFYPVPEARKANMLSRPVILSHLGWHDLLLALDIPYNSQKMVELAASLQAFLYYNAIEASSDLAEEKGKFPAYEGSEWSKGKFAQDLYLEWCKETNREPKYSGLWSNLVPKLPWDHLREKVRVGGVRNSNLTCNAPTATVSYIVGASQSFEPYFQVIYTYSTLSGEILSVCEPFYADLKKRGLLTPEIVQELRAANGDVAETSLPQDLKDKYATPYNIPWEIMVDANAARQVYVDQSQSFNLFSTSQSLKYHHDMFMYAWNAGCKTTYYLRSKAATKIKTLEESVVNSSKPAKLAEGFEPLPRVDGGPISPPAFLSAIEVLREEEATLGAKRVFSEEEKVACSLANPEACEACQ